MANNNLTYTQKKQMLQQEILKVVNAKEYKPALIKQYGECAYRLDIHDNIEVLKVTAPVTQDTQTLMSHWGFVQRTLIGLLTERKPNQLTNEQATALTNFTAIVEANINTLANFNPAQYPAETYRNTVLPILQTSYDAFIAYRNTIVKC